MLVINRFIKEQPHGEASPSRTTMAFSRTKKSEWVIGYKTKTRTGKVQVFVW